MTSLEPPEASAGFLFRLAFGVILQLRISNPKDSP